MGERHRTRALVADGDPEIADYLRQALRREGIVMERAADGEQAGARLRRKEYDLLFLSLRLPVVSGDFLLRLMERGRLQRPGAIALMGTALELAEAGSRSGDWPEIACILPKPFAGAEVQAFLDRSRRDLDPARRVLVGGAGLWADALAQVLLERGGEPVTVPLPSDAVETFLREPPAVVVLGPPIRDTQLFEVVAAMRAVSPAPRPVLIAVLEETDSSLSPDLITIGVDRVVPLAPLWRVSDDVMRVSGLARRGQRRVPLLAPVALIHSKGLFEAVATDLCEGGIGLSDAVDVPAGQVHLTFVLPGLDATFQAQGQIAWSRHVAGSSLTHRLGVRFTRLPREDDLRLREYIETAAESAP